MEVLFGVGVLIALWNWRKIEQAVLLLWLGGVGLFLGFLLWQPQESQHYLIAAPVLCILVSLGLVQMGSLLRRACGLSLNLSKVGISVILLALMAWNVYFYFGVYTPRDNYANAQSLTQLSYFLAQNGKQRYVYLFAAPHFYLNHGTIRFLANTPVGIDVTDPLSSAEALPSPSPGLRPLFVFTPERLRELDVVEQRYPGGQLRELRAPTESNPVLMYVYEPRE